MQERTNPHWSNAKASIPLVRRTPIRRINVAAQCAVADVLGLEVALEHADIGRMKVGRFTAGQKCSVRHPLELGAESPQFITITLQLKGVSLVRQHGRTMQLVPGSWGVCDAPEPCVSTHPAGVEQMFFLIPRDQVRLGFDLRFVTGRSYSGTTGVASLMWQTIGSLFEEVPVLDPRRAEDLADVVSRLFHLVIHKEMGQPRSLSVHEETRERICVYVENRLRNPRLSLDVIAADMNCTKRYLHMIFAGQKQTLNEYIWARRLQRCRADLSNRALKDLSITEIAMSWGFSNLSHFSRAFREQFGMTPRATRASVDANAA